MTIKDDIEAGRYPVDGKGRALVPTRAGGVATILATDYPRGPIAGMDGNNLEDWREDGRYSLEPSSMDLMPPADVPASPWRDIAGAPKDRTVDLWVEKEWRGPGRVADCLWVAPLDRIVECWCRYEDHRGWVAVSGRPTHYMLPPEGPKP